MRSESMLGEPGEGQRSGVWGGGVVGWGTGSGGGSGIGGVSGRSLTGTNSVGAASGGWGGLRYSGSLWIVWKAGSEGGKVGGRGVW